MSDKPAGMTLSGIAISPGVVTGRVRLVKDVRDRVNRGEIIVVRNSSSEWLVQLLNAEAVVSEYGGRVSHLAILCRQLGKPGVSAIGNALAILHDGDLIKVDGSRGEVLIYGR